MVDGMVVKSFLHDVTVNRWFFTAEVIHVIAWHVYINISLPYKEK